MWKSLKNLIFPKKTVYFSSYITNSDLDNKLLIKERSVIDVEADADIYESLLKTQKCFNWLYSIPIVYVQKEIFLTKIDGGWFLGNSGALVKDDKIIGESVFDEQRLLKSPSFKKNLTVQKSLKTGVYTSIMHLPWAGNNIYHWFIDCLPKLYSISKLETQGPITLIVQEGLKPLMLETLQFFLDKDKRLQLAYIKKEEMWNTEEFWLPSFLSNSMSGYLPVDYLSYVRDTILQGYGVTNAKKHRKIFISRQLASVRRMINESEVMQLLQDLGFEIVIAEQLSYKEQVHLFAEAKTIIGGHGAGLTNILFSTNALVVEIQPVDVVKSHYSLLSLACGHKYKAIYTEKTVNEHLDYHVSTDSLKTLLQEFDS